MSEEAGATPRKKRNMRGEGWGVLARYYKKSVSEDGSNTSIESGSKFLVDDLDSAKECDAFIKDNAEDLLEYEQLMVVKVQKKITLKIETKTVVHFE